MTKSRFHSLTVSDIQKTIRDAVVVTLVPDSPQAFDFVPGQYLTFRAQFDGVELRRNYSICTGLDDGALQVGIKQVDGGAFSTWANTELTIGDKLEAMAPQGRFGTMPAPDGAHSYLGIAGGSGITPVLSILKTTLQREPNSRFTLIYANRAVSTIMFREELEDLKNSFLGRLNVIHILEADSQDIDLFAGRLTPEKCAALFETWVPVDGLDAAFICGPEPMMLTARAALEAAGVQRDAIRVELFQAGQKGRLATPAPTQGSSAKGGCRETVTLDGRTRSFQISKSERLLDAFNAQSMDAPFACRAGVCSTCRAKVIEGDVDMAANHALEDYEVRAGYVLTCQAEAHSDHIVIDYDQ